MRLIPVSAPAASTLVRVGTSLVLVLALAACELFAPAPPGAPLRGGRGGNGPRGDAGTQDPGRPATPAPDATTTPVIPSLLGRDERLTILLLGSDARANNPGVRTDTMMVVSLEPESGDAAAVSIPRDIARFPIPGGRMFTKKINMLYEWYLEQEGEPHAAGNATKAAIGDLLGIEVDYWAYTGFAGVRRMVDALGGIEVDLEEEVNDPKYQISSTERGLYFPKGRNELDGDETLRLARSRGGDNDFARADRQQLLVMAAIDALDDVGVTELPPLVDVVGRHFRTDLPLSAAPELLRLASRADLKNAQRVVLSPPRFSREVVGSNLYQLRLDVDEAQELLDDWFDDR